uniref:Uncharacterized protein n=1 Tax=Glossina austeni TaxID=7395 RepID=A0A1A9UVL9_GLOAU
MTIDLLDFLAMPEKISEPNSNRSSMHKNYESIDYCANVSYTVIVAALAIAIFNGLASFFSCTYAITILIRMDRASATCTCTTNRTSVAPKEFQNIPPLICKSIHSILLLLKDINNAQGLASSTVFISLL